MIDLSTLSFKISTKEKRPGIFQVFHPIYWADGDMVDVFIEKDKDSDLFILSDHGCTYGKCYTQEDEKGFLEHLKRLNLIATLLYKDFKEWDFRDHKNLYCKVEVDDLFVSIVDFAKILAEMFVIST